MRTLPLKLSLIIMGISGSVSQIILLRELLVSFSGNELIIGIILGNWMILEAAGSFLIGKSVEKAKRKLEIYIIFQLIFSINLPFSIFLSRVFKNALVASPGEAVGILQVYLSSILIMVPVVLPHGALFTYGSKNYPCSQGKEAKSIGRVYFIETVGSIIGGLILTLYLIKRFNSFEIAMMVALLNTSISIFLLWPDYSSQNLFLKKALSCISGFLTLVFLCVILSPVAKEIHLSSIRMQWRGLDVIHNENSIYGNINVTKRGEQFTFFTDGVPSITTPVPDIASIEDFVHFPMLIHENPESVLVLSGGAGGVIKEILKYPVKSIDYVELDPLLLKLLEKYPTPLTQSELYNERVKIYHTDGRFFIKRTSKTYDIILVGLGSPQELQTNRLFSIEFFSIAKEKMNEDGIFVLTLPGSLTYISPELKALNGCIIDTLKNIFRYVRVIPGDVNIYLASSSGKILKVTPSEIARRLETREIKTNLITGAYIEYRLNERWQRWFNQSMERKEICLNSDFHPIGVFLNLSHWNAIFSPYLSGIFRIVERLSLKLLLFFIAVITLIFIFFFLIKPVKSIISVPYAIGASGFGGMIFQLAISFTFQTLFGYLYYQLGLLITAFMVGVAAGSISIITSIDGIKNKGRLFLITELCFVSFALLLPFAFLLPSRHIEKQIAYISLYTIFLIASFISGALVGIQFPVATAIHLRVSPGGGRPGHTAGLLYGADLFGGYFGGLIGGVVLLPLLGLRETCFVLTLIKISSFALFFLFKTKSPYRL